MQNNTMEDGFDRQMCGTLVARYKQTHDRKYSEEYVRRLITAGFAEAEARNLFLFELMILKSVYVEALADPAYIDSYVLQVRPERAEPSSWSIDHQMYLVSHAVWICAEAERLHMTDRVFSDTDTASFLERYLDMVARDSHTDMEKIRAYARAERCFLERCRRKQDMRPARLVLHSARDNRTRVIRVIREATGCSLPEAVKLLGALPCELADGLPAYKAMEYMKELLDSGADAELILMEEES